LELEILWNRIKEIPSFVSAIIAVVSAILALVAWIIGYFATQEQVRFVQCISDKTEEQVKSQILALGHYSKILNADAAVALLEEKERKSGLSEGDRISLLSFKQDRDKIAKEQEEALATAREIDQFLAKRGCGDIVGSVSE
jgi:hypothetical protein